MSAVIMNIKHKRVSYNKAALPPLLSLHDFWANIAIAIYARIFQNES